MVLNLCSCSISTIDEIIQLKICVIVFDPITITPPLILHCAVKCPEVLFLYSLWHTPAKRSYSVGISSLSKPSFGTNPLTGKLTHVLILSELLFQQLH